jgi:predicted ArsR family transcriptional regulator
MKTKNELIYDRVKRAADGVSKAEIAMSLGLTNDQVRKPLYEFVKKGVLRTVVDSMGVPKYLIAIEPPKESTPTPTPTPTPPPQPRPLSDVDIAMAEAADAAGKIHDEYMRGYNRGYWEAMKHSHNEAFTEGKRSVVKKLARMLDIDVERLL